VGTIHSSTSNLNTVRHLIDNEGDDFDPIVNVLDNEHTPLNPRVFVDEVKGLMQRV